MKKTLLLALLLPLFAGAEMGHEMPHMDQHMPMAEEPHMMPMTMPTPDMPMSTQKYLMANHAMHLGMDIEFTGTTDIDFLRGMIPHHQGAVDMANIVLEHGRNGNVKNLARRIINAQEREMRLMHLWLARIERNHGLHLHPESPSTPAFKRQNRVMHEAMNIEFTGNADIDFVRGMIPHHQGAVAMAKTVLRYGQDPDVRRFAAEVIADQQREIREMQRWLRRVEMRRINL